MTKISSYTVGYSIKLPEAVQISECQMGVVIRSPQGIRISEYNVGTVIVNNEFQSLMIPSISIGFVIQLIEEPLPRRKNFMSFIP